MPLLTVSDLDARTVAESVILAGIATELAAHMVIKRSRRIQGGDFSTNPNTVGRRCTARR